MIAGLNSRPAGAMFYESNRIYWLHYESNRN
nr:MAG TPA: hypothetical protein [Caudoviricetes sp.]